ncbi:hemagglutinin repeat-containing protein, partial [Pseudomonas sp. PA1(2017)]|uniref:hemagglutinin repeat-containing protein n=1 Tax=Pseudomonas sp. PA1(2017) TaxID=1932113 RepID=UPI001C48652B
QDLLLASQQTENSTSRYQNARNYSIRQQIDQYGSDVQVGGDLQAAATRDMAIVGSQVAAEGDMALQAGGSMTIASAANEYHYDAKRKGGGKKVEAVQDSVTQIASELSAVGDFRAVSGQDMNLSASRIDAGGSAYLYSGGQLNLLAAQNSDYSLYDKQSKGSFGAK